MGAINRWVWKWGLEYNACREGVPRNMDLEMHFLMRMLDLKMKLQSSLTCSLLVLTITVVFCFGSGSPLAFGQNRQESKTIGSKREQRPKVERDVLQEKVAKLAADLDSVCEAIARISEFAADFADQVEEIDVNPLLARPDGAIALDALIVLRA